MIMEVRCCCQPQKLLGWLPVPDDVAEGRILRFIVTPKRWVLDRWDAEPRYEPLDIISLPVASFSGTLDNVTYVDCLALKSEETPIERLRLIRGFIEAER